MGRATSNGNEAKSKMKHPSDMSTPRFEIPVVVICGSTHYHLDKCRSHGLGLTLRNASPYKYSWHEIWPMTSAVNMTYTDLWDSIISTNYYIIDVLPHSLRVLWLPQIVPPIHAIMRTPSDTGAFPSPPPASRLPVVAPVGLATSAGQEKWQPERVGDNCGSCMTLIPVSPKTIDNEVMLRIWLINSRTVDGAVERWMEWGN